MATINYGFLRGEAVRNSVVPAWSHVQRGLTAPRQRRAVCLDLDETLVHSWEHMAGLKRELHPDNTELFYEFMDGHSYICGLKRPYLELFLETCRARFDYVVVWTAGIDSYGRKICDLFLRPYVPNIIFTRNQCDYHVEHKGHTKDLEKMGAALGLGMDRILMVDNSMRAFEDRYHPNVLNIPDYLPEISEPASDDDHLLVASTWLSQHPLLGDFREYDKEIFMV